MLETRAVVVQLLNQEFALVQASQNGSCGQCSGKGCGASKLSQAFCSKPRQFEVVNRINAAIGDEVVVSVVEGAVLHGIGLLYLLPLLTMFGGAALAGGLAPDTGQHDGYAAVGAVFGLAAGFVCAKWLSSRQALQKPYIARRVLE